ncbi:MAG: FmdB family zinc ribbon protein [Gammaproteobacteria bacterium]
MPIYEYQCEACGHQLEALQKLSEEPLRDCPACGKPALTKLISAAGFRLKGGGWYETDFKSGGKRHLADTGGDKPAGEAKSDSKATDTKSPDTKKESKDKTATDKPAKPAAGGDKAAKAASS